jgi:hypothetical protein
LFAGNVRLTPARIYGHGALGGSGFGNQRAGTLHEVAPHRGRHVATEDLIHRGIVIVAQTPTTRSGYELHRERLKRLKVFREEPGLSQQDSPGAAAALPAHGHGGYFVSASGVSAPPYGRHKPSEIVVNNSGVGL